MDQAAFAAVNTATSTLPSLSKSLANERTAGVDVSVGADSGNVNEPVSLAGTEMTTTFDRSRTDVALVTPRAFPDDTKKPICSPTTGWWPIIGPQRES